MAIDRSYSKKAGAIFPCFSLFYIKPSFIDTGGVYFFRLFMPIIFLFDRILTNSDRPTDDTRSPAARQSGQLQRGRDHDGSLVSLSVAALCIPKKLIVYPHFAWSLGKLCL